MSAHEAFEKEIVDYAKGIFRGYPQYKEYHDSLIREMTARAQQSPIYAGLLPEISGIGESLNAVDYFLSIGLTLALVKVVITKPSAYRLLRRRSTGGCRAAAPWARSSPGASCRWPTTMSSMLQSGRRWRPHEPADQSLLPHLGQ